MYRVREERRVTVDLVAAEETVAKRVTLARKELLATQYVPPDSTCTMLIRRYLITLMLVRYLLLLYYVIFLHARVSQDIGVNLAKEE